MLAQYSTASQEKINANRFVADQDLADYLFATAGKDGMTPYLSPLTLGEEEILARAPDSCK